MARQYLKNNHVTYYVITQVGVYAEQWYVLRPTWRGTAGQPESRTAGITNKVLEAGVQTSYVHSSKDVFTDCSKAETEYMARTWDANWRFDAWRDRR